MDHNLATNNQGLLRLDVLYDNTNESSAALPPRHPALPAQFQDVLNQHAQLAHEYKEKGDAYFQAQDNVNALLSYQLAYGLNPTNQEYGMLLEVVETHLCLLPNT